MCGVNCLEIDNNGPVPTKTLVPYHEGYEGSGFRLWGQAVVLRGSFRVLCSKFPFAVHHAGAWIALWNHCDVPHEFSPKPSDLCHFTVSSQTDQTAFLLCLLDPRILGALMKTEELRSCG